MTLKGIALAAVILAASEPTSAAACHRYSVWRYPWRQSCTVAGPIAREMARWPQAPSRRVALVTPTVGERVFVPSSFGPLRRHDPAMPLPSLARADLDGGEADEPTRARVLLRAALQAANAH